MRILLFVVLLCAGAETSARLYYVPNGTCDGWPHVPIEMAAGYCAGLVLGPTEGAFARRSIRMPRILLLLDPTTWLVTDLGGWNTGTGAVWRLSIGPDRKPTLTKLLGGLAMPHAIAIGPDRAIYVGEMSRIFRFDPSAADPSTTIVAVVTGLPDNRLHENRHPLSHFIFDGNGDLVVNVGAPSDQCAPPKGQPRAARCADVEGERPKAALYRYRYAGGGRWATTPRVVARGLRNSLVLLRHRSGTLLQAENSIDFPEADVPYEEINVIRDGAHYGWPYCFDIDRPAPVWAGSDALDCGDAAAHAQPAVLLPPHTAPLGAVYYEGAMWPALRGKLLMTFHGYREAGSRLVAFDVDANGVPVTKPNARYAEYGPNGVTQRAYRSGPAAEPEILTPGWNEKPGARPAGAPVGIAIAADGAIWLADDRNAAILRIARER